MNVCVVWHRGSRFPTIMTEGLQANGHHVKINKTLPMLLEGQDLRFELLSADLIFIPTPPHLDLQSVEFDIITKNNLWSRVIVYDFKDQPDINKHFLARAQAYFKRAYYGQEGVHPLNYAAMDVFYTYISSTELERDIDYGFFYDPRYLMLNPRGNAPRIAVFNAMSLYGHLLEGNNILCEVTTGEEEGRQGIHHDLEGSLYGDYLKRLRRSKNIITVAPYAYGGDSRTWEAFASGALVSVNNFKFPAAQGPWVEDGKHALVYEPTEAGVEGLIDRLNEMSHEEKDRIRKQGFEFVMDCHRSKHRIEYVYKTITQRNTYLRNRSSN